MATWRLVTVFLVLVHDAERKDSFKAYVVVLITFCVGLRLLAICDGVEGDAFDSESLTWSFQELVLLANTADPWKRWFFLKLSEKLKFQKFNFLKLLVF
jgi:hypothetical protein